MIMEGVRVQFCYDLLGFIMFCYFFYVLLGFAMFCYCGMFSYVLCLRVVLVPFVALALVLVLVPVLVLILVLVLAQT